jgi:uncharacterized protein (DUF302 family)
MLESVTSERTVGTIVETIEASAQEFGLSVLNVQDLRQRMTDRGHPFPTEVRVVDVCSAPHASQVLSTRIEIATAMPCRIAVYEKDGRRTLSTLRPTELLPMFGEDASLQPVAEEIERRIVALMRHAAS